MARKQAPLLPAMSAEFGDADLGDVRLNRRLGRLANSVGDRPGESFPKALNDAELEAAYRFFGNAQVLPEAILAPHVRQTARRAAELPRILVVHDTTTFEFGGQSKREGLGHLIKPSAQGFFGHFSLAIGGGWPAAPYRAARFGDRVPAQETDRPQALDEGPKPWRVGTLGARSGRGGRCARGSRPCHPRDRSRGRQVRVAVEPRRAQA
jgi:hypothetical protein